MTSSARTQFVNSDISSPQLTLRPDGLRSIDELDQASKLFEEIKKFKKAIDRLKEKDGLKNFVKLENYYSPMSQCGADSLVGKLFDQVYADLKEGVYNTIIEELEDGSEELKEKLRTIYGYDPDFTKEIPV